MSEPAVIKLPTPDSCCMCKRTLPEPGWFCDECRDRYLAYGGRVA